ncbi:MAG: metallophosphoesterase family protein, partial [Sedimentisphaerales bacterium]|nr:metallophosphoesterase family protein [Sedimentisphaerales bacterium]
MILIGISDIHSDTSRLDAIAEDLCKADAIVLSGDITNFGNRAAVAAVIKTLHIYNKTIVAVPGNCDPPEVSDYLSAQGMNLDGTCMIVGEVAFVGIGGSPPCPSRTPNESSEIEYQKHLAVIMSAVPKT